MFNDSLLKKLGYILSNKSFSFLVLLILVLSLGTLTLKIQLPNLHNPIPQNKVAEPPSSSESKSEVLGRYTTAPQIYISGGDQSFSSGGMIALASTDEPAVQIAGYKVSGPAEISMYEADEEALLDYLTHDKDGKQTKKAPDLSKLRFVTTVSKEIDTGSYQGSKVTFPFSEKGIWYLKVKINSVSADAFVLRSNIGVLTKEGDDEFIFWGQNFKTKRSISDGTVQILSLQDGREELQKVSFNAEGIAKANLDAEADIALVTQNDDRAIVPINLKYLNTGYSYKPFQPKGKITRYFIFTDRPLYRPGDTVNFKAVFRDDDDARYTIPSGEAVVNIYPGYEEKDSILEKSYPVSADGTISGTYQLPADAEVGAYHLSVNIPSGKTKSESWDPEYAGNTTAFDVEFFRKPEFSIDLAVSNGELIAGDKGSFKISGTYFSGQPLMGQKIKYSVYAADFYEYQYLTDRQNEFSTISQDYRYGYWYGEKKVTEGTATLNKLGEAEIDLDTRMYFNKGKSQVFSISATLEDGSQTPSFSHKNALIYAGEYGIYRQDYSYGVKVNTPLSIPLTLASHQNQANVSGINLKAQIHRENWVSFQEADKKYPSYKKEEEDLPSTSVTTDSEGKTVLTFTPTKIGSYRITVEGNDSRGNTISKIFYSYVSAEDQPFYSPEGDSEITIAADKQKYSPGETARFTIFSQTPNRDVFFSLERGKVNRFRIVRLNGKTGTLDVPLVNTDIPNIYIDVSSFSNNALDSNRIDLPISSDSKKLVVNLTPGNKTSGPGETVTVDVLTTDVGGKPISAELALWAVDKAIFELSDNKLGDIFKTFWKERYNSTQRAHSLEGITVQKAEMGGCFAPDTKVLMGDGSLKNIQDIKTGDYVLTRTEKDSKQIKAKVLHAHTTEVSGYLIVNGSLKVTANHILRVNNSWKEAGSIQIGDTLIDTQNRQVKVSSIEWQQGKFNVHNLEIEKYHTFFAGGVWVHNEKGIERNVFKDTAYWNPSVRTDSSGKAKVSFVLPDNLTSWVLAAVASTTDTKVGQTTSEVTVTKDIIVRPILPNILRLGDEAVLSALVQNFTQEDQTLDVDLQFDSGSVGQAIFKDVVIKSQGMRQLYWRVKPTAENDKSKLIFSARVKNNPKMADVLTQEIPIRPFGFTEKRAESGEGDKNFNVKLAADSNQDKSKASLYLSSTMVGTLPVAMNYLIDYPYGCSEQTASRLIPAIVAKMNPEFFNQALEGKDLDAIIQKTLSRVATLQQSNGGWSWWSTGQSNPFITAHVVESLLYAEQAGVKVDEDILNRAKSYLYPTSYYDYERKQEKYYGRDQLIAKAYALALLGDKNSMPPIVDWNNLSPDLMAMVVISNYLKGDTNPQTNGLTTLSSLARFEGDALFWESGNREDFGSRDASTAMAIRAILLAQGDKNLAAKGARYLSRSRQFDYWSNTFATSQVVRALAEVSKVGDEWSPNYNYSVSLDGKQVAQGAVTDPKQVIKEIPLPISNLQAEGSNVSVFKNGEGQIYSTLVVSEFRTDQNAKELSHGLTVRREYANEKGEEYSLGVGDTALVKITIDGLKAYEHYGVIEDQLPSGMVPVNESFKNEQYGDNTNRNFNPYDISDQEITENGIVLSVYQLTPGRRTYTYRARVISEGTFIVPPATASLMYAPEVYGRSKAETIKIDKESQVIPVKRVQKAVERNIRNILEILPGLLAIAVIVFILKRKGVSLSGIKEKIGKIFKRGSSNPPVPPQPIPDNTSNPPSSNNPPQP